MAKENPGNFQTPNVSRMKSLSLIQAIVLLHRGERLSRRGKDGQFVRSAENIMRAQKLASEVLGRNLGGIPFETQKLFLLIEKIGEGICKAQGVEIGAYRFTKEDIRANIGWSGKMISKHLAILVKTGYLESDAIGYRMIQSSRAVVWAVRICKSAKREKS